MKIKNTLTIVAAVAAAMFAQASFAQASAPSRAEVKAETKSLEKSGKLTPAGEAAPKADAPTTGPKTDRATRKAETAAAQKAGKLMPAGEADAPKK